MIGKEWASSGPINLGFFINNQYVTVKKIGVGGFGTVWLAYDFSLRNFVAIKELLPEYAEPKFVEMFYKDALIAKNIIHDNVVRVQHFWQGNNGSFYIVLDYVRGMDLEVLLKKCREKNILIPWQLATLICMNVLKAVDYANRVARDSITGVPYGIVYRDISPGNVLLSFDGNIKLSDFGVAKTADEIQNSLPERVITGKYPYMSPEQVRGEADVDHRTDIFSLGSLYYEILTGEQLYQGTNEEIREQIISKPFDTAKILEVSNSQEIADIISKALRKNRESRYERAIDMYKDVRRVLRTFDTEDLAVDLANFIAVAAKENITKSERIVEAVKALNINDVQKDKDVVKIQCKDFIVGQPIIGMNAPIEQPQPEVQQEPQIQEQLQPEPQIQPEPVQPVEPVQPAEPVQSEPQVQPETEEKSSTISTAATAAAAAAATAIAATMSVNSVADTSIQQPVQPEPEVINSEPVQPEPQPVPQQQTPVQTPVQQTESELQPQIQQQEQQQPAPVVQPQQPVQPFQPVQPVQPEPEVINPEPVQPEPQPVPQQQTPVPTPIQQTQPEPQPQIQQQEQQQPASVVQPQQPVQPIQPVQPEPEVINPEPIQPKPQPVPQQQTPVPTPIQQTQPEPQPQVQQQAQQQPIPVAQPQQPIQPVQPEPQPVPQQQTPVPTPVQQTQPEPQPQVQQQPQPQANVSVTAKKTEKTEPQPVPPVQPKPAPVPQQKPLSKKQVQQKWQQPQQSQPQVEAKGKTVFEEVGDWLFKKFDNLRKTVFKLILVLILAIIILLGLDVFLQITPFGKGIYAKLNPPDVIITTTPEGALVGMKTKSGEVILNNQTSNGEIPVRKVLPGSYIITALKEGFKPVQRVVQIEPSEKANKVKRERIEIMFDFVLNVNSVPEGASVYVDGNKFGVTPCNVQLVAAPHTIKLSMKGFADLGSNAKESKAGQCNVDFSHSDPKEIFSGVDSKFWKYEMKNMNGEDVFCVSGDLFKQVEINTDPEGMTVQIEGENSPRGTTPLHTQFKVGTYKIKLLDPSGRYGEMSRELEVNAESETKVFVKMNKFVTFNVKCKNNSKAPVSTTVKVSNNNTNISEAISASKPFKIALPVEEYDVLFLGTNEFKPVSMRLDVNTTSNITAEMEYIKMAVTLTAKDSITNKVLPETFVWMGKTLLGKTDKNGIFKTTFLPGNYDLNFINKDYEQQLVRITVSPGKKLNYDVAMNLITIEDTIATDTDTANIDDLPQEDIPLEENLVSDEKENLREQLKAKAKERAAQKAEEKKQQEAAAAGNSEEQQTVVCPHCGYVNTAPASRKLRFCLNCAKPLK